jgi:hypothetical protein
MTPAGESASGVAGPRPLGSFREVAVVVASFVLLLWYRARFALPAPLGGHALLHRWMVRGDGSGEDVTRSSEAGEPRPGERVSRLAGLFLRALERAPPVGGGCVPNNLALVRLLRLHRIPAELRIGLRRTDAGFTGHAWVVHDGAVIGQRSEFVASFVPMALNPPNRRLRVERTA